MHIMFNTTTIPTTPVNNLSVFLNVGAILSLGLLVGASFIEVFLYRIRERERASSESESESESEEYCNNYLEEFEALPLHELSETELKDLNTKFVREFVAENVEVILTFDKNTETFWYYTDKLKNVSYDQLETVARKFAIEHNCKMICLQTPTAEPVTEPVTEPTAEPIIEPPSVFAKFKNYNTGGKGASSNFTSVVKVVEQMNHFRYRGKLCDYVETQKLAEKSEESILDYASYKKLIEKKTL